MFFRVIVSGFPKHNIYRFQARLTTSLGAVIIATVAKEKFGVDSEVIDENNYRKNLGAPFNSEGKPDHYELQKECQADIVGISCGMSNSAPRAIEIIKFYASLPKNFRPKAIIIGGWHAMDLPQDFLAAGADLVVCGEAEPVLGDIIATVKSGGSLSEIKNSFYQGQDEIEKAVITENQVSLAEMDSLPDPNFNLVRYAKIRIFPIGRTRGCSGKCRFCRVKSTPRWISPQRFLDQVIILASKGAKNFFVIDDRSEEDLPGFIYWLKGLAEFQKKRKLRLFLTTQNRLSLAENPEILNLMRQAGVGAVAIGYESPIPEILAAMRKPINPDKMIKWAKVWKRAGFYIHAMFIFGYPLPPEVKVKLPLFRMSVKEQAKRLWQFIKKISPDTLQILLFTPLPGTEDRKSLEPERILPIGWEYYDGNHLLFMPDKWLDPRQLQQEQISLMRRFYAFYYIWRFGSLSLLVHFFRIAMVTTILPFVWPFIGFRPWLQIWRKAKKRFQGHLIVMAWLKDYRRLKFIEKLPQIAKS